MCRSEGPPARPRDIPLRSRRLSGAGLRGQGAGTQRPFAATPLGAWPIAERFLSRQSLAFCAGHTPRRVVRAIAGPAAHHRYRSNWLIPALPLSSRPFPHPRNGSVRRRWAFCCTTFRSMLMGPTFSKDAFTHLLGFECATLKPVGAMCAAYLGQVHNRLVRGLKRCFGGGRSDGLMSRKHLRPRGILAVACRLRVFGAAGWGVAILDRYSAGH